jgi:hypothetical protein
MKSIKLFKKDKAAGFGSFNINSHIDEMYKRYEWKEYSKRFLAINPKCYACGSKSEHTDHVKGHNGNEELFWKTDNLMPLCQKCHSTVTGLFDRKKPQNLQGKLRWVSKSRAMNALSFPVKVVPRKP